LIEEELWILSHSRTLARELRSSKVVLGGGDVGQTLEALAAGFSSPREEGKGQVLGWQYTVVSPLSDKIPRSIFVCVLS